MDAAIWVDRAGQKPIVIGADGERLKRVGRAARLELNQLLGQRLHLTLWVKVRENWADNARALQAAGTGMSRSLRRIAAHARPTCCTTGRFATPAASSKSSTREHGRLTLFARGVRGPNAKLASVCSRSSRCCCPGAVAARPPQLTGAESAAYRAAAARGSVCWRRSI